jgi:uncharacterized protein
LLGPIGIQFDSVARHLRVGGDLGESGPAANAGIERGTLLVGKPQEPADSFGLRKRRWVEAAACSASKAHRLLPTGSLFIDWGVHLCILWDMECEWDPAKAKANLATHGIHFADAVSALRDDLGLTIRDPYSEDEERWITLGVDALGRLLVVICTWRGERVRLISARLATPHERQQYEESHEA